MTQATVFQAIAPRPAPIPTQGVVAWLRANLFSSPLNSLMTLAIGALLLYYLPQVWQWAVSNAVWIADADQCHQQAYRFIAGQSQSDWSPHKHAEFQNIGHRPEKCRPNH